MLRLVVNNEITPALRKYASRIPDALISAAGVAVQIVIARAIGDYMRDARGEPRRRSPLDNGPLRIVFGRLARSLTGARTGTREPESIYRIASGGGEVKVTFGSAVPYAAIHEFGGRAGAGLRSVIPGRPYLGPALAIEEQRVINLFDQQLQKLAKESDL